VTSLFTSNSQIAASLSPLVAVRWNPPPASAKLGENMPQFVAQSSIDFGRMLD
jgi:hypothetical protein